MGEVPFYSLLTDDSPRPLLSMLRSRSTSATAEVRFKAGGGMVIDAVLSIGRIKDQEGERLYVFARDISESKQKELDLLRFSNVVHYTVNPIQITDAEGRMVYVNPAFEKATGYTKEELIGCDPNLLSSRKYPKEFWLRVWAVISSGKVWNGEIENRRKNGDSLYTQLLISPIIDNDGKVVGYLGSHRDITEQKAARAAADAFAEDGEHRDACRRDCSRGGKPACLHLLDRPGAAADHLRRLCERQARTCGSRRSTGSRRSSATWSISPARRTTRSSPPTSSKGLTDAVEIVKMGKKAKEITFVTHVRRQVPLLSLVPDQIAQVFINILLNAVDALQGKTGTITSEVERDNDRIRVTITDNGQGISPENLSKIFEPFFTTKPVGEGTGLGLWVSYGIVREFRRRHHCSERPGARGLPSAFILPLNRKGVWQWLTQF